ncbi:MAG: DegT/DnrJ/EryC1/StrS family aminotransferase [Steroidobacteraceae bacterium]
MPVHLYGQVADLKPLLALARRYGLKVIEGCGPGHRGGGLRKDSAPAVWGTLAACLFFPTKNLGAFGDAGMCVTQDAVLAERMNVLRVHGGKPKYYHSLIGGNFRLDELQAAVLNVKLPHLDAWTPSPPAQCGPL